MKIYANDQTFDPSPGTGLAEFLTSLGYTPGQVVVERNGEALTPSEIQRTCLAENDRLEIVQIVAGG